ncbi:MAG: hypothetical protein ACXVJF_11490 [Acidimicrobiia bacterium]
MRRRTLDLIFSVGGLFLAVLLLVLGLVLQNQADFAKSYVHDQLAAQKIVFTPVAGLAPPEKASCIVDNAGKPLTTGHQAECYANHYIAVHLSEVNKGKTYAETSGESRAAGTAATAAAAKKAPNAAQLDATAKALDAKTQTLFRGETLRGLLLTSYGFSIFGERAQQAAIVCFAVAAILLLAGIAGFVHAFTRRDDEVLT